LPVSEPNLVLQTLALWGVPFVAYYLGIFIRKKALPGMNSPPLMHQCLLGIPVSLVIVSPLLAILRAAISTDVGAYLLTVGIIMEHGMLVQETANKQLKTLIDKKQDGRPGF
jgi:hypothetical protein